MLKLIAYLIASGVLTNYVLYWRYLVRKEAQHQ